MMRRYGRPELIDRGVFISIVKSHSYSNSYSYW